MFVTIVNVNGQKSYFGPFESQREARKVQMDLKAEAVRQFGKEKVSSEVVELQKI